MLDLCGNDYTRLARDGKLEPVIGRRDEIKRVMTIIKAGQVKSSELKKEELPAEMQKLTPKEQQEYLKKVEKRRTELRERAVDLDKKRGAFIAKKLKERDGDRARDSFDNQVLQILQRQAGSASIQYGVEEKKK